MIAARNPVSAEPEIQAPPPCHWGGGNDVIWCSTCGTEYACAKGEARPACPRSTMSAPDSTQPTTGLDLAALRAANIARQAEWCPDQVPDLSFRGNELAGEGGEAMEAALDFLGAMGRMVAAIGRAANTIKKLERERHGWAGSRATKAQLAEELADVVICADLCGITADIPLAPAVVAKFNATSDKVGLTTRLAMATDPFPPVQAEAELQVFVEGTAEQTREFVAECDALEAQAAAKPPFRAGDHVLHDPSGETWVVAWADPVTGDLAWCGWPDGVGRISDCTLVKAVSDAEHQQKLRELKASGGPRAAKAVRLYGEPVAEEAARG